MLPAPVTRYLELSPHEVLLLGDQKVGYRLDYARN